MDVGVRELRDHLSRHLASVRAGHTVTVTDHGKPVARIVPVGARLAFESLVAAGRITPGRGAASGRPTPRVGSGVVSDLVADQRR